MSTPTARPELHRPLFVGRQSELERLQASFDGAASGQSGLVMLVGEPGIGKTTLCEQLAAYAISRGGRALIGHCYEEGSLSLPYLPFVDALRAYVREREIDVLRAELSAGAPEIARVVPEVGDRLQIAPRPPGDPEQDRWRLFRAITDFLRAAASARPLLLVIEDLHDADRGTLELLLYLARNFAGAHLLVVGTYRDVEVDRVHPLSAVLAELRRAATFERFQVRGLTVDDVQQLLRGLRVPQAGWALAEAIQRQTEGNPLFVQEIARYLLDERSVRGPAALPTTLPEGLRDVIGKRLSRLSAATNAVLSAAAVNGREFRLDVLKQLVSLSDDDLEAALIEASGAGVIEERSTLGATATYRFTHALFRQALYEELIAPRRIRLHQQVARALEEVYGRRLEDHASELAEHYAFSSGPEELAKAVAYGELAARRAMSVYAYSEAERHLQRAAQVQEVLDPDDSAKRCDLLLALCETMLPTDQVGRVAETVAAEAFAVAEARGDRPRAATAAVMGLEGLWRMSGGPARWATLNVHRWLARADQYTAIGTAERVYTDCYLGMYEIAGGNLRTGAALVRAGLESARALKDEAALLIVATFAVTVLQALRDRELVEKLAVELLERVKPSPRMANAMLVNTARVLLECGARDHAEQVWRELAEVADLTGDAALTDSARVAVIQQAFLDGQLERAVDGQLERAVSLHEATDPVVGETGTPNRPAVLTANLLAARAQFYLGRAAEVRPATFDIPNRVAQASRAVALSFLGQCDEAAAIRARFGEVGASDDESGLNVLVNLFESSVRCRDTATAAALLGRLAPLANRLQGANFVSIGRLCGEAAVLLGQAQQAAGYYAQALDLCQKTRFRPELALTRLDLAELLLAMDPPRRAEAVEHLDLAIAEFRAMNMQPSLERALAIAQNVEPAAELGGLTPREREVAALLADGLSNRDIAAALVITAGTAEVHVKRILSKLGFRSRSQVAVWAREHGVKR